MLSSCQSKEVQRSRSSIDGLTNSAPQEAPVHLRVDNPEQQKCDGELDETDSRHDDNGVVVLPVVNPFKLVQGQVFCMPAHAVLSLAHPTDEDTDSTQLRTRQQRRREICLPAC